NHLTSASASDGTSTIAMAQYKYDVFGNLIEEDSGVSSTGTVTRFAVDGWNPANQGGLGLTNFVTWAVINHDNSLQSRQLYSVGTVIGAETTALAHIDGEGASDAPDVYWQLTDRLNSVSFVIDNTVADPAVDTITYTAFGLATQTDGTYLGHFGWDGY